jgi:murein L,D-transpeptidase YcbB/YkuD
VSLALALSASVACSRGSRDAGSASPAVYRNDDSKEQISQAIRERVTQTSAARGDDARLVKTVDEFYAANGYQPAWFDEDGPLPTAAQLQHAVDSCTSDGLDPASYDLDELPALHMPRAKGLFHKAALPPAQLADADVRATLVLASLASHLRRGRVKPGDVDKHWFGTQPTEDLGGFLKTALQSGNLEESLHKLTPRHPQYEALKKTMTRYREIAAQGGWGTLPDTVLRLKPGQADPTVAALAARLAAEGDLPTGAAPPATFDATLRDAVKHFESRHGFTADGRLDKDVLAAMNVPVADRIRQLEVNLERWRWLPEELGRRHILVNIPTYHLTAFNDGRPELEMRVVTGKTDSPTPIFNDVMTTVVFSPYWNVPPDILKNEVIPAAMRDPGYLDKNNMEVVRGTHVVSAWDADLSDPALRVRQRPGPKNSLGHVKFMFPNQFDVYLHDTPAEALFGRVARDYSHGCVRVEKPFELAQWVLQGDSKWTPETIQAAMDSGEERHVALKDKIPVYIQYQTAWVDGDGTVQFREDVYGHDASQGHVIPASPAPVRLASR